MKRVVVYVQHLLGVGHLHRTALLTSAIADRGIKVTVVSGGMPETKVDFGDINLVQLPPIQSDFRFSELYDENLKPITAAFRKTRRTILLSVIENSRPDLMLIETFPFGRRQMRFELLPLLNFIIEKTTARPIVACSIRDIIQPKFKPNRIEEVNDLIAQYFDIVLVHGDKRIIDFEQTFPASRLFSEKLMYTGYVAKSWPATGHPIRDKDSILVSAGGGAVGKPLYETAIRAADTEQGKHYRWRILVGNNISESEFVRLCQLKTANIIIERVRSDFLDLLARCSASISQGGYNTMMDILITASPAVIVPFEGESEQEQLLRAKVFAHYDRVTVLREKNLSETALIFAIQQCLSRLPPEDMMISLDGADQTADLIDLAIQRSQALSSS